MTTATDLPIYPGPTLGTERRDALADAFHRDGFVELPVRLDDAMLAACSDACDALHAAGGQTTSKVDNCVDAHPAFRRLMLWTPICELCHDLLGPSFQLNQSNCMVRPPATSDARDFTQASAWHADGPRPRNFPSIDGIMGLHYCKFACFFSDLRDGDAGSLQVVRGSHRRPELDARGKDFRIEDYAADVVRFDCAPGTVVAFHQALWHAAPPNTSRATVRRNCYLSYSPTWMRPFDRTGIDAETAASLPAEEAFLLGAPRPWQAWWLPDAAARSALDRYAR